MEPNLRALEIERSQKKPTQNLSAYDYVLRAMPNLYLHTTKKREQLEAIACN